MHRSGLALAVLALLYEAPMHPYEMQRLLKGRNKDAVVNVGHRAQLYKTIDRLLGEGLIVIARVERDGNLPERTVYAITDTGRAVTVEWTIGMLTAPRRDFPEFAAGLAYLGVATPEQVISALTERLATLSSELADLERDFETAGVIGLPRVVSVEAEYMRAHLRTDIEWIGALLDDLRNGDLTWNLEQMLALGEQFDRKPE